MSHGPSTTRNREAVAVRMLPVVAVMAAAGVAGAADAVLNPTTYASPSGAYDLFVDPTTMGGEGSGLHRLRRDGDDVWSDLLPFTLHDAIVTDDGIVAGYTYAGGVWDTGHHGYRHTGLSVVVLGPDGEVMQRDDRKYAVDPRGFSGSDSPYVNGLLVDAEADRFVVRAPGPQGGAPEVWWTYRLSDGAKTGDVVPAPPETRVDLQRVVAAERVPGTPLTLLHWYCAEFAPGRRTKGAALSLYDRAGARAWHLDLAAEYDELGEDWLWHRDLMDAGVEQIEVEPGRFHFTSYETSQRISFAIEADPADASGWRVAEIGRVARELPVGRPPPAAPPEVEVAELEFLGTIELRGPELPASPIRDVTQFGIDPAGALSFVRSDGPDERVLVRVDQDGTILTEIPLDLPETAMRPQVVAVSEDRWVILHQRLEGDAFLSTAWWLDAATGHAERIEAFAGGHVESVAAADGGFIVLGDHRLEYTSQDELQRFDADGDRVWNRRERGYGQGFSFRAATWLRDGRVAALTSRTIEFFGPNGEHAGSTKIADVIGTEPNYPSGLTSDCGGGLILEDFNGSPPIYRIDADGRVVAKFRPRFADGRTFRILGAPQCAPDGALWTADGHALLRLDADGVVDRVLGPRPDQDDLGQIAAMTVDPGGLLYVVDERTAVVYVFEVDGTLQRVCRPRPTDFAGGGGGLGSITVDGAGHVFYTSGGAGRYLHMDADGQPIGFEQLGDGACLFRPGTRERWGLGYRAVHLIDAAGRERRTIERRPDRTWLERVERGAVAPDGALVVVAAPEAWRWSGPRTLNVYDATGDGVRTIPLVAGAEFSEIAFDGTTVFVGAGDALYLYPVAGGPPTRTPLPEDGWWFPHVSPDGREIWVRNLGTKTLLRYRIADS